MRKRPVGLAASPARYVVERGAWKEAASLEVRPNPQAHIVAVTWFARALGAARSGNTALAEMAIGQLVALRDALRDKRDAYWAEQVDIQAQVANAWLLLATGRKDEALAKMSAAADAEEPSELDLLVVEKSLFLKPTRLRDLAIRRMQESRAAAGILGVAPERLFFLGYPDRGIAVALDQAVLPRSSWATTLSDGAQIQVGTAVQGG